MVRKLMVMAVVVLVPTMANAQQIYVQHNMGNGFSVITPVTPPPIQQPQMMPPPSFPQISVPNTPHYQPNYGGLRMPNMNCGMMSPNNC
jgi:hypothetical protein